MFPPCCAGVGAGIACREPCAEPPASRPQAQWSPPTPCHRRTETRGAGRRVQGLRSTSHGDQDGASCLSALPWARLCGPGPAVEPDPGRVHGAGCTCVSGGPSDRGSKACFPEPAPCLPTQPPASPTAPGYPRPVCSRGLHSQGAARAWTWPSALLETAGVAWPPDLGSVSRKPYSEPSEQG